MNFSQIAAQLNYSTIHHFSRQFKDKFGMVSLGIRKVDPSRSERGSARQTVKNCFAILKAAWQKNPKGLF